MNFRNGRMMPLALAAVMLLAPLLGASACSGASSSANPAQTDGGASQDDAAPLVDDSVPDAGAADDEGEAAPPPYVPAPHRPFPKILPHSGTVLRPLRLVTIVTDGDPLASQLIAFGEKVTRGDWWKAVGADYGLGAAGATAHLTGPAIAVDQTPQMVTAYIQSVLTANDASLAPDGRTLYLLYLPNSIGVVDAISYAFHNKYPLGTTGLGDGFAVVSHATPPFGETELDLLTNAASHEIIEAATDPTGDSYRLPRPSSTPWLDSSIWSLRQTGDIEVGDLCERARIRDADSFLYQRSWSLSAALAGGDPCVPTLPIPYENVSIDRDWVAASPGETVSIPFTGWATAPTADWFVNVGVNAAKGGMAALASRAGLSLTSDLGVETAPTCGRRYGMNNGIKGALQVTVPPEAQTGDYTVLSVYSFREVSTTCNPAADDDDAHFWPVGVYVK